MCCKAAAMGRHCRCMTSIVKDIPLGVFANAQDAHHSFPNATLRIITGPMPVPSGALASDDSASIAPHRQPDECIPK